LAQPKLSSIGLSYLCHVKPSGPKPVNSHYQVWSQPWHSELWTELWLRPKEKFNFIFLAHLRLDLLLGSAKRLSHGPSQTVKSPTV